MNKEYDTIQYTTIRKGGEMVSDQRQKLLREKFPAGAGHSDADIPGFHDEFLKVYGQWFIESLPAVFNCHRIDILHHPHYWSVTDVPEHEGQARPSDTADAACLELREVPDALFHVDSPDTALCVGFLRCRPASISDECSRRERTGDVCDDKND